MASDSDGTMLPNNYRSCTYSGPISIVDRSPLPNDLAKMSSTHHHNPYYIPTAPIFKGTVVRAKAIKSGSIPSKTVTRTYFVTPSGSNPFSLPVVSLSLTESKLFDYNNGIFVAGAKFDNWRTTNPTVDADPYNFDANFRYEGDAWERTGNINYFENGVQKLNQDIGIRINGGYSRGWQSKSLRLLARADYGNDSMNYPFFIGDGENLATFNRLVLRNSGGDFFDTLYRDALADALMKGTGMETMAYQPTITFVNGEYWGILSLRERFDEYYFKNVCGIDPTELDFMQDNQVGLPGSHYNNMYNFLNGNSLAIPENFDYIKTQMDVDNMRDYYIANIYYDNTDWPHYNTLFWRKKTTYTPDALYGLDGRWRAAMKDNDDCFGSTTGVNNHNNLAVATDPNSSDPSNPPESTLVLRSLLANPTFKNDFINRFADLMNTYYLPSRFIAVSTALKNQIQPEIQEHLDRWKAADYGWWEESINLMNTFGNERPNYQRQHIRQKFGINSNINATLDVSDATQGYVKINTIDILPSTPGVATNPYPWTGVYFHNIPVKIKAIPLAGYAFSYWSGASSSTSAEITITPTADFSLTAHFIPSGDPGTPVPIYFWMMNDAIPNDKPLLSLSSTYEIGTEAVIQYQSCLVGYPFTSASPNYHHAAMERRNSPTSLNYMSQANNNVTYPLSGMKGLQIKQPFQSGGLQNTMVFNFSTQNYKDIKFAFAVLDEGAATGITLEYATNASAPVWTTAGMTASSFPITAAYQRIEADLKTIPAVNNNPNFKIRLRFTGPNLTADTGANVTFNNISVEGVLQTLSTDENTIPDLIVYPNPVTDVVHLAHRTKDLQFQYKLFGIDGKMIQNGTVNNDEINLSQLSAGLYLLQLNGDGKTETKKILKR